MAKKVKGDIQKRVSSPSKTNEREPLGDRHNSTIIPDLTVRSDGKQTFKVIMGNRHQFKRNNVIHSSFDLRTIPARQNQFGFQKVLTIRLSTVSGQPIGSLPVYLRKKKRLLGRVKVIITPGKESNLCC